jgi:hypothetical protein
MVMRVPSKFDVDLRMNCRNQRRQLAAIAEKAGRDDRREFKKSTSQI